MTAGGPRKLLSPQATVLVAVAVAVVLGTLVFSGQLFRRDAPGAAAVGAVASLGILLALLIASFASRRVAPASRLLPWVVAMGPAAVMAIGFAAGNYRPPVTDALVGALIMFTGFTFFYRWLVRERMHGRLPQGRLPIFRLPTRTTGGTEAADERPAEE